MRIKWQDWIWLPVTFLGGTVSVILTLPEFEPITGFVPKQGIIGLFLFVMFCFGGGTFLVFKSRWYWKFLGVLLLLIGLIFSIPLPSKAGMKIHLMNESDSELVAMISQVKQPERYVQKALPPHKETIYRTAPGEYAEGLEIKFQLGGNTLETRIIELRNNRVVFSSTGIALQAFPK